jgi:hypothetical protein
VFKIQSQSLSKAKLIKIILLWNKFKTQNIRTGMFFSYTLNIKRCTCVELTYKMKTRNVSFFFLWEQNVYKICVHGIKTRNSRTMFFFSYIYTKYKILNFPGTPDCPCLSPKKQNQRCHNKQHN